MVVRGEWNALLRPGLRKDFRDNYMAHAEEFSRYLKVGSQDRAEVEAITVAGLPRMIKREDGESVRYIDPAVGTKVTFVDDEYALGFQVSRKMVEDDQYGKANSNAKWLGRSAKLTQEYQGAALLDDAFTGTYFTGDNGEALCSTTHYQLNGSGTWSNSLSPACALSVTGIQAAFELGELQVDQNGDPIPMMLDFIVCDIADEWVAMAITQSELEPYTTDNQVNVIRRKRKNLTYMVSHYKTQGREWFMQDKDMLDAHFLFRRRPTFEDAMDFDTSAAKFMGSQRINVYFFDPRGWVGSNP